MATSVTRAETPVHWDLTEIYASDESWSKELGELHGKVEGLEKYNGKLGNDAATLKSAMESLPNAKCKWFYEAT